MKFLKSRYLEGGDVIEINTPATTESPSALEAEQHRVIVENWESFAAAAYEGFRRFGVGAIVIEEDKLDQKGVRHPFLTHMIWYATTLGAWVQQGRLCEASGWLEEQMEHYDPRLACIFVFLREDEEPRFYLAESTLTPAQALSRVKALLN